MSRELRDRVIVALDQPDAGSALDCARALAGHVRWVKVGMTLYYAQGPSVVATLRELGLDVFLDLKLHDIPHQVGGAARVLGALGAGMLTVHGSGGRAMVQAAVEGSREGAVAAGLPAPAVLGVTVLTSLDADALAQVGVGGPVAGQVERLARLVTGAGADGVVCAPGEAAGMRALLGPDALVVTPGVRPVGAQADDQARVATPAAALAAGASHLVIGRPITGAPDAAAAFERIIDTITAEPSWTRPPAKESR